MTVYNDYPIDECAEALAMHVAEGRAFFQKWTCEGCGERVTGNTPNKLFTHGHCEECGHVTDIKRRGCNYMLLAVYRGGQ
jgi:hypothetical protein